MPTIRPLTPLNPKLQIPHYFRCPISLELMRDPVILSTGQSYDRSSIEKWVANGNTTCPVTMQQLEDFTLIPNHTLRRLIQEWCVANRSMGVERIPTPKQPADPGKIRSLMAEAAASGLGDCNSGGRWAALRALRCLAKDCEQNRVVMAQEGVVQLAVKAVFNDDLGEDRRAETDCADGDGAGSSGRSIVGEALATLVLLPLDDKDRLNIMQEDRLGFVSFMLTCSCSMDTRVNAGALVEALSDSKELPELRVLLAKTPGVVEGLVALVRELPRPHPRAAKVGIKALFSLCLRRQGKEAAVAAGAAAALVERLMAARHVDKSDAERALGAIELLCTTEGGCRAVASHPLSVAVLVKVMLKVSERATEFATGSLLALCGASEAAQKQAVQAGVVKELLLLIQSDCTQRGKAKAMSLLKLLRSAWPLLLQNDLHTPEYGRTDVVAF